MASRHRADFTRGGGYMSTSKTLKALREMGEHVVKAAKQTLKECVDEVVIDVQNRAPQGRTGNLKGAVKAIPNKNATSYEIQVNDPALNEKSGIPYGQFVEFDPRIGGNPSEGKFLYPTTGKHKPEIKAKIEDSIRNAINRGH